jgi:hypothetical protein
VISQDTLRALFAEEESSELSNIKVTIVVSTSSVGVVKEMEACLGDEGNDLAAFSFADSVTIDGITADMLVRETEFIEMDISLLRQDTSRRKSIGLTKRKLCDIYDQDKRSFLLAFEMFVYNGEESVEKGCVVCNAMFKHNSSEAAAVDDSAASATEAALITIDGTGSATESVIDKFLDTALGSLETQAAQSTLPSIVSPATVPDTAPPSFHAALAGTALEGSNSGKSDGGETEQATETGHRPPEPVEPAGPAPSPLRRYSSLYGRALRLP